MEFTAGVVINAFQTDIDKFAKGYIRKRTDKTFNIVDQEIAHFVR